MNESEARMVKNFIVERVSEILRGCRIVGQTTTSPSHLYILLVSLFGSIDGKYVYVNQI